MKKIRPMLIAAYLGAFVYLLTVHFDRVWPVLCPIAIYIMPLIAMGYLAKNYFVKSIDAVFQRTLIMVLVYLLFIPFIVIKIATIDLTQYEAKEIFMLAGANVFLMVSMSVACYLWLRFSKKTKVTAEMLTDKFNLTCRPIVVVPLMIIGVMGTAMQKSSMALNFGMETLIGTIFTLLYFYWIRAQKNPEEKQSLLSLLKSPPMWILAPTIFAFALCILFNFYIDISFTSTDNNYLIFTKSVNNLKLTISLFLFGSALLVMGSMLNFRDMYRLLGDKDTIFEIAGKLVISGVLAYLIAMLMLSPKLSNEFILMAVCCASMVSFVLKLALDVGLWEDFCAKFTLMLFLSMLSTPLMYMLLVG